MGRRLLEIIPYVPIATTVRIGVSIFTYCGNVTFGITGDYASNPDLDVLAHGIERGLSELLVAAKRQHLNSGPTLSVHAVPVHDPLTSGSSPAQTGLRSLISPVSGQLPHDPMVGLPEFCQQIGRSLVVGPDGSRLLTFVPSAGQFRPDILD